MTEKCDECGDEFDSERGLHIHQAQKHGEENNDKIEETQSILNFEFTRNQFASTMFGAGLLVGLVFVIGLLSGMLITSTGNISAEGLEAQDIGSDQSADKSDEGSGEESGLPSGDTIDISNTGIGTGDMSFTWEGGEVDLEGSAYAGSEDANTVIVSYEDFTCSFCGRHNTQTFPTLVEDYVNEGEVQYVYKNFPVLGGWNRDGAVAAECAAEQNSDAFWSMKNHLYQNQGQINTGNIDSTVKDYASNLGLDTDEFNSCYDNQETMDKVDADLEEGRSFDYQTSGGRNFVEATPSFLIYNRETGESKAIVGAQPLKAFEDAIKQ